MTRSDGGNGGPWGMVCAWSSLGEGKGKTGAGTQDESRGACWRLSRPRTVSSGCCSKVVGTTGYSSHTHLDLVRPGPKLGLSEFPHQTHII